jgi:FkbH-like protein
MNATARLREIARAVPPGGDWPSYAAAAASLDAAEGLRDAVPENRRVRIAVLASFTADPIVPCLRVEGARAGMWVDVYLGPYRQYMQELFAEQGGLLEFAPHVTFVAVDGDAMWDMYWAEGRPPAATFAAHALEPLMAAVDQFRDRGSGIVVLHDVIAPMSLAEGALAFADERSFSSCVPALNRELRARAAERPGTLVFPLADVVAEVGRRLAFSRRQHYRGHVTWSDRLTAEVAARWVGYAAAAVGLAPKCIVLDLDNTLWGGVLGEDGAHGIAIGPQWPGREFVDFQRQLLDLQRQGILLAVCSKNNEPEALAVIRDHPDMLIREHHLAGWRIDWEDKASNLRRLAAELNLGLEHLLFIDDSPHERAWVREQIPELAVPDLPADPSEYAVWLGSLPSLVVLQQTEEDRRRTELYREERVREQARIEAPSQESFLRSLRLRVGIEPLSDATMTRTVQLFAKTNQFNLTTRRHDEPTLRRQTAEGVWRVHTLRVADRFGDFGIAGAVVVEPRGEAWHVESLLMSCRVIGKSVESALIAAVARDARRAGATRLTAEFIDSGRNAPARTFLAQHGFGMLEDGLFARSLEEPGLEWPDWISPWGDERASVTAGVETT